MGIQHFRNSRSPELRDSRIQNFQNTGIWESDNSDIYKFRDLEIQDKIKNLDWRSVVIWECETKNIENLRDKIIDVFS